MAYILSPSSLSLFKECPRCFWLQLNKNIRRPAGVFPSLPSGMDRILKNHFDSFREKGLLPPELKSLDGEVKLFSNAELLKEWRNNRKGIRWQDPDGNVLMGALDNLLTKAGKLIVLDYKTRGFPLKDDTAAHYQDQLDIYCFLLRKNGFHTEDYAYLLFYHPERVNEKGDVLFHTDLVKVGTNPEMAEHLFKKALDVLKGEVPEPGKECEYCQWMRKAS